MEEYLKPREFSFFEGHINYEGMTEREGTVFWNFLSDFHDTTKEYWIPRGCTGIPALVTEANRVMSRFNGGQFGVVVPKRYLHSHYFLVSELENRGKVIIDPTGVPSAISDGKTIVPYFGLSSEAPGAHFAVYANMGEMDDWGTRELPPCFYP